MLKTRAGKIIGTPTDTGGSEDVCLDAMQVRVRYGNRSDMWLWRLLENDPGFPRPLLIRNRRYWRLSELTAWEETKRSAGHAA